MTVQTDKRYRSRQWKAVRARVLARDLYRCQIAPGCMEPGDVCDHINPVYMGMPDSEFFDEMNLRAACHRHNTARGIADRLRRDMRGVSDIRKPRVYSYGRSHAA